MWHAKLSRREFIEMCLGAQRSVTRRLERAAMVFVDDDSPDVDCYWERETDDVFSLPTLAVVRDPEIAAFFTSINASPQAATPITAICRVLTRAEARKHFDATSFDLTIDVLPITVALAMAEATLHADGRIGLRQVTAAMCKRTLSYAWGRALARRSPVESFTSLPARWLETYQLINAEVSHGSLIRTVGPAIGALSVATQLSLGIRPDSKPGAMAYALLRSDPRAADIAWRDLVQFPDIPSSLDQFAAATREERGTFLQLALQESQRSRNADKDDIASAACAFIATQVAPGSLEHFELLRTSARPDALLWYVLYATTLSPNDILTTEQSLGRRLLRDIEQTEDQSARPIADIAFMELKALERIGITGIARKLGHVGEVEVELIPYVTSSFTYHSRSGRGRETASQLSFEADYEPSSRTELPIRVRMNQLLSQLIALTSEIPDKPVDNPPPPSQKSRKK